MTTHSDLRIPPRARIEDRACDWLESAIRLQDDAAYRRIAKVIAAIHSTGLCWQLGALYVASPSGANYRVTRAGCDCPNGRAGKRACYHITIFELLLDLLATDADSADMAADYPPLGSRIALARSLVWGAL